MTLPAFPKATPFHLILVSKDSLVFNGDVNFAIFPGISGDIGLLKNHLPLLSDLRDGFVELWILSEKKTFNIVSGILAVSLDSVRAVVEL